MSRTYNCMSSSDRQLGMAAAEDAVRDGQLVVLPTDTLYGIGCDAFNNQAVAQLLAAKHRGPDMPVPVLVGSWDTIKGLVATYSSAAQALVEAFWPGGLSIVVPEAPSLPWNLGDTRGTVMLRMPAHPVAIELLRSTGPMAVSSANISGMTPPAVLADAERQLGNSVSVYLDGGEAPVGLPSTIIDISGVAPKILREGAVTAEHISEVLGIPSEQLRGS